MTLREIHERCKARHFVDESADGAPHPDRPWCGFCFHSWPCEDYADAVAALAILGAAEREDFHGDTDAWALVYDPEPA